jgi:hypothetical protein
MKKPSGTKRKLFAELMEGVDAMRAQREGKVTLRTHRVLVPTRGPTQHLGSHRLF